MKSVSFSQDFFRFLIFEFNLLLSLLLDEWFYPKGYCLMDHSPFRQTFQFGILISTAGKSILNLVKW